MRSFQRTVYIAVCLPFAAAVAACGGGGGSAAPGHQGGGAATGTAVLAIPNRTASSTARSAQFLSASAVSVGVSVNGGAATFSDISTTSPLCTATATGRTCTITITALPGNDVFTFTFYDGANGSGTALGSGSATINVAAGTPFSLPVAVTGVVSSIDVSVPVIEAGPTSVPVTVAVKDPDGNTIVGPVPYPSPITLSNSDTTGTLTLSKTTVTAPTDVISLTYNGNALTTAASISATAGGISSSKISPASVLPLNYFPQNLSRTYSGTYTGATVPVPVGSATPLPTETYMPQTFSYTTTIVSGGSYGGFTGVQTVNASDNNFSVGGTFGSYSGYQTYYQQLQGSVFALVGASEIDQSSSGFTTYVTYPTPLELAALPFVSGATIPMSNAWNRTTKSSTFTATAAGDASGNQVFSQTYPDGSSETTKYNADSSESQIFSAGSSCSGSSYDNELPCTLSSATATYSAPSSGTVTITVTHTTTGGAVQTGTLSVSAGALYPNGAPTLEASAAGSVGAPVTSLPAGCNVTVPYQGPVIPVTYTSTFGNPDYAGLKSDIEVDYLAPNIGPLCVVLTEAGQSAGMPDALSTPTALSLPSLIDTYTTTEIDALTSVGPALQAGTITTNSIGRRHAASSPPGSPPGLLLHRPTFAIPGGSVGQ